MRGHSTFGLNWLFSEPPHIMRRCITNDLYRQNTLYTYIGSGENRGSKLSNQRSAISCWAIADWLRTQRSYWTVSIHDFPRIRF